MRIFERAQYFLTLMFVLHSLYGTNQSQYGSLPIIVLSLVLLGVGNTVEAMKIGQLPCLICQLLHLLSHFVPITWLNTASVILMGLSYYLFYAFGECSLKLLGTPIGPYAVGVQKIWTKTG